MEATWVTAVAQIQSLTQEFPCAAGTAKKKKKKKKKTHGKKREKICTDDPGWLTLLSF